MSNRPNIVLMVADDHRHDAIHAFGDPIVQTPVLDSLAERGVSFSQTHVMGGFVAAVCVPSRACMLTGTNVFHASASKAVDDYVGSVTLNPDLVTLPKALRQTGYRTHAIGKWHNDTLSFTEGFESDSCLFFGGMSEHWAVPIHDFDASGAYRPEDATVRCEFSTELFADAAVRFLENYDESDPFLLYVAFTAPHDPRTPPGRYGGLYSPRDIKLPENMLPIHPFDNGEMDIRDEHLAPWPRTPEIVRQHIADYYGMISHLDAEVGRILEALRTSGFSDNTIVVYTADHGLAVGQHGLMGKQNLYEHSVRIPLIFSGPSVGNGRAVDTLVSNMDIAPTLCELAETPIPESIVDGKSLAPHLSERATRTRPRIHAVYKDVQRMISDGQWKLIRYYRSSERNVGTDYLQLFNLVEDPAEMCNLASDPAQRSHLHRLAQDLEVWQQSVGDPLAEFPVLLEHA